MKSLRSLLVPLLFSTLALATAGCTTVNPGEVSVKVVWGKAQPAALEQGFYFLPPGHSIIRVSTQVKKTKASASASSKDLQVVTTKIALNYRIDKLKAVDIYSGIGDIPVIEGTIIQPALQEAVKASTAKYTAQELITKREDVKLMITEKITSTLSKSNLVVTELSVTDFQFTTEYQNAVEAKQIEDEMAKKAENKLRRIEIEARQVDAKADGEAKALLRMAKAEAEAQELLRKTITPEIVQLRAIEKWDGKLSTVSGGSAGGTFLNVGVPAK